MDNRRGRLDLLSATALAAAVLAAAPGQAREPKLTARGLLRVEALASSYSPTSKSTEEWRVARLARIDRKHFLALLKHWRLRHDVWAEAEQSRKAREAGGVVTTGGPEVRHNRYALAILRRDGKPVDVSDEPREAKIRAPLYPGAHAIPLVMDRTDACPYALLQPTGGVLLCFDLDLHFIGHHRLPLDEIIGAKVTFDGVEYTLWLFGARYGERPTARSWKDVDLSAPAQPEAYGVRFTVGSGAVEPVPVTPGELHDRLRRIARNPEGERVELDPTSIRLAPFRDLDRDDTFWVMVQAVSSERRERRSIFSGTRLYFRARLSPQGLGTLQQLPLWVVQEERERPTLDFENGVFHFPRYLQTEDLQAFSLGDTDLAVRLKLAFKLPEPDGTFRQDPMFEVADLLGVFRGVDRPASWIAIQEERRILRWRDQLAKASSDLDVLPGWFLDRVGRYEFAFRAACRRRGAGRKMPRAPCVALLELEY